MPPNPSTGTPADWLRLAQSDLALALLEPSGDVLPEMLCFHAQQAVEKALKALLVDRSKPFPRTHNLVTLLGHVDELLSLPSFVRDSAVLTDYAVSARYPGVHEPISDQERLEAAQLARDVLAWVKQVLDD